ncbi:MAG: SET domain-containing protein-lysine N-methyltransferase [Gammaproteobacteria bacterium]|jgi:SET domain-containing protein|nr:SET domain-containing protein-lysine N-methyltransferase [Gammaproteobacteria bacterium]
MDRNRIARHLQDELHCRIGVSGLHGVGVIAVRRIPKGTRVLRSTLSTRDIRMPKSALNLLPAATRRLIETFCEHDHRFFWLPRAGLNAFSLYQYLNHSKKPNVMLVKPGLYVATSAIRAGEELTLDYDLTFGEKHVFRA